MDTLLLDSVRYVHLLALAVGLGMALLADVTAISTLWRPISTPVVAQLRRLHNAVLFGFVLLWMSGLGLLFLRTGFDVSAFTPKLVMKLIVVGVLTLNAGLIGLIGLPHLARNIGRRFGEVPFGARVTLSLIAGLSAGSWLSALALGVFAHLRPMALDELAAVFGAAYALFGIGAIAMACVAPLFGLRQLDWIDARLDHRSQNADLLHRKPYVG